MDAIKMIQEEIKQETRRKRINKYLREYCILEAEAVMVVDKIYGYI